MELASVPAARARIKFLQIQTEWGFLLLPSRGRLQPAARCSRAGAAARRAARSQRAGHEPVRASPRRLGRRLPRRPGSGTRHPSSGIGHRTAPPPPPAPPQPACSPRTRAGRLSLAARTGPRAGSRGPERGPGDPPKKNFLWAGPRYPVAWATAIVCARRSAAARGAGAAGRAGPGPGWRREAPGESRGPD